MRQYFNRRGFSIVEVLVVVAIASIVVLVVGNFSANVGGLDNLLSQDLQSKSDINQILDTAAQEIRSAAPSAAGAYAIDSAGTSSFSFYSDINQLGVTDRVRYFLASSSFEKGVIVPTGTPAVYATSSEVVTDLIDNVVVGTSTSLFSYYDNSYTGTQAPLAQPVSIASIRLVQISFLTVGNASRTSAPQSFSILAALRNLKSNQ